MSNAKKLPGVKGTRKIPAWQTESLVRRLHRCCSMLAIHGFLSDAQSKALHARITSKNPK